MDKALDLAGNINPGIDLNTDAYIAKGVNNEDRAELAKLAVKEVELLENTLDKVELTNNAFNKGILYILPIKAPR